MLKLVHSIKKCNNNKTPPESGFTKLDVSRRFSHQGISTTSGNSLTWSQWPTPGRRWTRPKCPFSFRCRREPLNDHRTCKNFVGSCWLTFTDSFFSPFVLFGHIFAVHSIHFATFQTHSNTVNYQVFQVWSRKCIVWYIMGLNNGLNMCCIAVFFVLWSAWVVVVDRSSRTGLRTSFRRSSSSCARPRQQLRLLTAGSEGHYVACKCLAMFWTSTFFFWGGKSM